MANEKKPSIYQDRGTIGSVKELDEYGVWVKSEPQDLANDDKDTAEGVFLDSLDELPDFSADFDASSGSADSDFSIPEDDFSLDSENESGAFSFGEEDQSAGEPGGVSLGDDDSPGFSLSDEDLDFSLPDDTPAARDASSKDDDAESPAPDESNDDDGFDEISLEDLLGGIADELPGEDAQEEAGAADEADTGSSDKSTRLLMQIAEELSSIRAELSALKQEFSAVRGNEGESHGFFNDADTDDKIALTGDELNNILNTAEFTEESGVNAAEEDSLPGFSEGEPAVPADVSPETETSISESAGIDEVSLDDLEIAEPLAEASPESAAAGELSLDDLEIAEPLDEASPENAGIDELSLDDLEIAEPLAEASESGGIDELSLDDLAGELELSAEAEEPIEIGELPEAGQLDELDIEALDSELSLVDLSDAGIGADFPAEHAASDTADEGAGGITEFSLADSEIILEESPKEETEESGEPDISLDASFSDEEISLDNFEEETLDLTGAVIEEPDLGAEIKENPVQEPGDIASFDEALGGNDGELSLEAELSPEEPALEILEESDFPSLEEINEEINREAENSGAEEGVLDISPAGSRSRGEDLDQIIPEGFVVEELDDEGVDFGGIEGALDEIPGAELPEEDIAVEKTGRIEIPDEPEVSALPGGNFKVELKQVLSYMDQLLESLPEEKIEEFAKSEYFDTYKKLFKELGLA